MFRTICLLFALGVLNSPGLAADADQGQGLIPAGVARIDITPDHPIRLTGYSSRKTESEGVAGKLHTRALAIGTPGQSLSVIITVDNCAVPGVMADEVAAYLKRKFNIPREHVAVCSTHTHTGPALKGSLPLMFAGPLPPEHLAHVDQYTAMLQKKLEQVAEAAVRDIAPARLQWGEGTAGFAMNRRVMVDGKWKGFGETPTAPVDHDLPVLTITAPDGKLRGIFTNYACHCTTLGGKTNHIHGDWAGEAAQQLEARHDGAVALVAIGCGADANPSPRGDDLKLPIAHGKTIADAVGRVLEKKLTPLTTTPHASAQTVELPFDVLPTKEQLETAAKGSGPAAYHAQVDLERLNRGEALPKYQPYMVQTWTFGDDLAMVFLPGEVVVDYALRMKKQFDGDRLWINAYSNDVPSYIPSRRILTEGGYEADSSMHYYGKPTRYAPEVEDIIVDAVQKLLPREFYSDELKAAFPEPLSPQEALRSWNLPAGYRIELVAAEPLVVDPVAFDWGADGRLWVVEMRDYPDGMDGHGEPGGRVKVLTDTDGDGKYDKATVFLDKLSFPTGIKTWHKGVLLTVAPELLYAEDTDGDDVADVKRTLYAGFGEENQQHRVNGLRWGLDNWLYIGSGSGGGGEVTAIESGQTVQMARRDLRIQPDQGRIDVQSGHTQFGRERDDWGNWFGGNNSNPIWHYVYEDHYLRRNPYISAPQSWANIAEVPGAAPVFPASRTLERFNQPHSANRFTSACSPVIYRDNLMPELVDNWLVCEPVHNLVHREVMERRGTTFHSARAPEEKSSEFLASTDNWARPSMIRVGPDGALWLADMYRFVIEHPRWIPQEWLRKLEVRAGDDMGRIYRIVPADRDARPMPRLDLLDTAGLVKHLEHPSGWVRDMAQQMLLHQKDPAAIPLLKAMLFDCPVPQGRLHALCTLDGLSVPQEAATAFVDPHDMVICNAVRIAEKVMNKDRQVGDEIVRRLSESRSPAIRMQVAYSLGEWKRAEAGEALGRMLIANAGDRHITTAVLSSVVPHVETVMKTVLEHGDVPPHILDALLNTAIGSGNSGGGGAIDAYWDHAMNQQGAARTAALVRLLEAIDQQNKSPSAVLSAARLDEIATLRADAHKIVGDDSAPLDQRRRAIALLGDGDTQALAGLVAANVPLELQSAAVAQLAKVGDKKIPGVLLDRWAAASPQTREQILDVILSRSNWIDTLLTRMQSDTQLVQALGVSRREQLLRNRNADIALKAAQVLGAASSADRQKVVQDYVRQMASLKGDTIRGQRVFLTSCAVCHKVDNVGRDIGPDLLALASKPDDQLVLAILDPNSAVEARFVNYVASTRDGRSVMGLIKFETSSNVTLVGLNGIDQVLLRSDIASLISTGRSLMPEGLEMALKPQDMADLLAYLRTAASQ